MAKVVVLFVIVLLTQVRCKLLGNINEYDVIEEAKELIQKLRDLLLGELMSNTSKIENLLDDLGLYRDSLIARAEIDLQQLFNSYVLQLVSLKELAEASGKDISVCLNPLHEKIVELYEANLETLPDCSSYADRQMKDIEETSIYRMNTLMNDIEYLSYEIDRCEGEFPCISSIVTKINLAMVSIPQKLEIEVNQASALTDNLKLLIQSCIQSKVGQLSSWGLSIVNDAAENCL